MRFDPRRVRRAAGGGGGSRARALDPLPFLPLLGGFAESLRNQVHELRGDVLQLKEEKGAAETQTDKLAIVLANYKTRFQDLLEARNKLNVEMIESEVRRRPQWVAAHSAERAPGGLRARAGETPGSEREAARGADRDEADGGEV